MKTLLYAGAGYDEEVMKYLPDYDKYIFYDTLPNTPHYTEGQMGWEHTKTQKVFFKKLKKEYGKFERKGENELYFPGHNLTYFYNTDANDIKTLPDGDILIRGYWCESWNYSNRCVIISCDTCQVMATQNKCHFHKSEDFCFDE